MNIRKSWELLRKNGRTLTAGDNFSAHTALLDKIQSFELSVDDSYALTLDPDIDTYYIIDSSIKKLPDMIERMGRISAYGSDILTNKQLNEPQKIAIHTMLVQLDELVNGLVVNMGKVADTVPQMRGAISAISKHIAESTQNITALVATNITAGHLNMRPVDFVEQASTEIAMMYGQLRETLIPMSETLLKARITRMERQLLVAISPAIILFLVAVYFAIGICYSVISNIKSLSASARKFANGDMRERIHIDTKDELNQAGGIFNEMADGFNKILAQLKEQKFEQEKLNVELEDRVGQRTAQLQLAKDEAEQASRSKSLFLTSMRHELRTPLNAILGYAQLLQMDAGLPEYVVKRADEIRRAGDYLLALVNDILDLASIESGRLDMQIDTYNLFEIIRECQVQNSSLAKMRNIALVLDDRVGATRVYADRRRLLQLMNNLVSNAVKYSREGGKVTISCRVISNDRIRISVTDTGFGITPEQQENLFNTFNRLGAEMGKIEGTGIGLVIARQLTEGMNGSIGLNSTPGSGSTFWVELLTVEISAVNTVSGTPLELMKETPKFRILVAEDYPANQTVIKLQLQALGCEADIVADGAEALEKWRTSRYQLILADLNMPVMDGLAFTWAVREQEHHSSGHIPIIGITAATVKDEQKHCRAAGMDDVLSKPISLEDMSDMLSRWLGETAKSGSAESTMPATREEISLDASQLYRILGKISLEQARELVATFLFSARQGLNALDSRSYDAESVSREMHKLKSSAQTVGAMQFAKLAEVLEKQSKENKTVDFSAALTGLRFALDEIETEIPRLQSGAHAGGTDFASVRDIPAVTCRTVMVVDDDPVMLQQMWRMLDTLGVQLVLTAINGVEAINLMSEHGDKLEALICDLNMPEMDGVELIRKFGQTGFKGGLILMSGADEKVLSTVSRLAGLHGLRVLGQVQKPVMLGEIAELLSRTIDIAVNIRKIDITPQVTREEILVGMANNEFSIWFQPKVDALSLKPAGFEALARWQRPGGNFMSPDIFITVAEQENIIGELSKILVSTALREGSMIFSAGFPFKIAINLSGRWLDDLNLPEFIHENTIRAGLHAEDVILEVTETGVMEDLTTALDVLTRLRPKGFGLSIDDFGIGYSSFEQLGRIPFTELKLDRSFVNKGASDPAALAILEGSMDMARKLKLSSVAEGVETELELELIRTLGCDRVQGYLIAKPMPLDQLLDWLRNR